MPIISASGVDTLVNTNTANFQTGSRITALASGRYLVTWAGAATALGPINLTNYATADIRAQIYNANGTPSGSEFVINATTAGVQIFQNAIELSDGNILVTWQDGIGTVFGGPGATPAVVRAQEFTSTGVTVGSEFQIATGATSAEFPSISPLANGGYVVVWQAGGGGNVLAQIYDSSNATVGSQVIIDNSGMNFVAAPSVATLNDGNFVVAWTNAPSLIAASRVFSATGAPVTGENNIGFSSFGGGRVSNVIALTTGGYVIGYGQAGQSDSQLHTAFFSADGTYLSDQLVAVEPANNQTSPRLVALSNGGYVAYWSHLNSATGDFDVYARGYGSAGDPFGTTFTVNSIAAGAQNAATGAALLSDGSLVFSWNDASGTLDASGTGIALRRFAVDYTNTNPVAVNDAVFVNGSTSATINIGQLLSNDSDADGDAFTVVSVANAVNGSVSIDLVNDTINFTPNAGTTGPLSFTYTVSDTSLATSTATVSLGILQNDAFTVRGNSSLPLDIFANDIFPADLSGITVSASVNSVITPIVSVNGRPQILYNPASTGPDYFNLLVGQSDTAPLFYTVSRNGAPLGFAQGTITRQGWAQLGGAGNDNLTGSVLADHLSGDDGTNVLTGLGGDDWYTVTNATTTVVEASAEGFDYVRTSLATYVLADNVENLAGLPGVRSAASWTGNALNNNIFFVGSQFSGTILGLGGNDALTGSFGNDTLDGGDGDDILNGGSGTDTASYASSNFGVTVHLDIAGRQDTVQQGMDTLIGIENLTGSASHDSLWGDAGNNTINGGAGFDLIVSGGGVNTLIGGADGDTYFVQGFNDTVTEAVGGGFDIVLSQVTFTLAAGSEVEALAVNTTSGIALTGNEFQQTLTGNVGNDALNGGGGNDLLISGGGTNTLIGGSGADIYFAQGLNDLVVEDAGGGFDVVLAGGNLTLASTSEVEVIAVNTASGVTIIGSDITQTIQGGAGDDRFIGGLGNDTITGSGGADTFVLLNSFADRDFITDFASGSDKLEISAALFGGGLAAGVLSGAQFFSGAGAVSATTAAQRFIYNSSTGNLLFDADGNGAGAAVLFANLSSIPTLTAADFLIAV